MKTLKKKRQNFKHVAEEASHGQGLTLIYKQTKVRNYFRKKERKRGLKL
jgi:hypothetical protein